MREPRKFTVTQLLSSDAQFVIPNYQRGYDWKGDSQVKDLFVDLLACIDSDHTDPLFLGSMIFDVSKEAAEGTVEIIDGQQRVTTLLIVLIAARSFAKNTLQDEELAVTLNQLIRNTSPLLDEGHDRLMPSATIADAFHNMCDKSWDGKFPDQLQIGKVLKSIKRQNSRVKPVYSYSLDQIEKIYDERGKRGVIALIKQIVNKTFIIRIDIDDKAEAFEIFERTNARGKGLEVSDLLKNFLFSREKDIGEDVEELWDEITSNAGGDILRMLKYFWISRRGHVSSRDLYRKMRYYAHEIGVSKFVLELVDFSKFYKAFYANDVLVVHEWLLSQGFPSNKMYLNEFRRIIAVLRMFRVTQVVPVIYSTMAVYSRSDRSEKSAKKVLTLLRFLESYHFVNNKICNRIGNEIEKGYAKHSEDIYYAEDLNKTDSIISWLDKQFADENEFSANFLSLSYSNPNDRNIIRYVFDKVVNDGAKDGQRIDLLDIETLENGVKASFDIEHLYSQSAVSDDEAAEYVHQIGNLLVIPRQINGILGNSTFHKKMAMLRDPHKFDNNIKNTPSYVQKFVSEYGDATNWNRDTVTERTASLGQEIYKISRQNYSYK